MKQLAIFVDVSNLYFCLGKEYGKKLKYKKYLNYIEDFGDVVLKKAYGAQVNNEANKFIDHLNVLGFDTYFKEPRKVISSENNVVMKADWDVGITLDIMRNVDIFDTLILGSADGDFRPLIEYLQSKGKSIIVIACNISQNLKLPNITTIEIPEGHLES